MVVAKMKTFAQHKEAGFTLVEVLISLFIFALLSAGTTGVMIQTFAAKDRLNEASAELSDIALFRSILRSDMNALTFRPMRDGVGGTENFLVTTRNPAEPESFLTFSRLGRSNPAGAPRGQVERVRYLFRDGQFIRESLRHENPAQRDDWSGRVLLGGLENVGVSFLTTIAPADTGTASQVNIGTATSNLRSDDWIVLVNDNTLEEGGLTVAAVEFTVTNARGVQTVHLFELGQ